MRPLGEDVHLRFYPGVGQRKRQTQAVLHRYGRVAERSSIKRLICLLSLKA